MSSHAPLKQDLHIHTVYSTGDSAVVPQMTIPLIASLEHAEIRGISDHFDFLTGPVFERYRQEVHSHGFWLGCEVNDSDDVREAVRYPYEYYIYHCRNEASEYRGAEILLETGRPVIISHPLTIGADLDRVPPECLIEVNNRYVWRADFEGYIRPHLKRFRFVIGSDAHQPHWLNHLTARHVVDRLGIEETLVFPARRTIPALQT